MGILGTLGKIALGTAVVAAAAINAEKIYKKDMEKISKFEDRYWNDPDYFLKEEYRRELLREKTRKSEESRLKKRAIKNILKSRGYDDEDLARLDE